MWNDIDLLSYSATQPNMYVCRLVDVMFKKEELKCSILPGKKGLVEGGRVALDPKRIQLIKSKYNKKKVKNQHPLTYFNFIIIFLGALFARFVVPKLQRIEQWDCATATINRKCYDSNKIRPPTPKRNRKETTIKEA